jgi:hypothetical protein
MALSRRPTERCDDTSAPHSGLIKTLLFVLLATALSVRDDVTERVQLSKIKDIEKALWQTSENKRFLRAGDLPKKIVKKFHANATLMKR